MPAWPLAAGEGAAIRAAYDDYQVPAAAAEQAGRWFGLADTLVKANVAAQLGGVILAEWQGLQAEWDAATHGQCQ